MELISRQAGRMTAEEAIATLKANYPDACYEQLREAVDTAIEALGKDINVPTKSALDHIHNVVAENAFNKGYDAGHAEGYERGKKDTATLLAIRITTKYDEVLGVGDALEEIDNLLEEVAKGE